MIPYSKKNQVNSPELSDVKIGGYAGALMNSFLNERVLSDFAKNVIYQETEDAFKTRKMTKLLLVIGRVSSGANG